MLSVDLLESNIKTPLLVLASGVNIGSLVVT